MNVIEIFAKFICDTSDFDKGLDQASNKASSVGSSIAKGLGGAALGAATALASAGVAAGEKIGTRARCFGGHAGIVAAHRGAGDRPPVVAEAAPDTQAHRRPHSDLVTYPRRKG